MTRFRVDFSIRELDVPEEQARGVRFGDEVELDKLYGFFDRCRDAVRVLFNASKGSSPYSKVTVNIGSGSFGMAAESKKSEDFPSYQSWLDETRGR